MVSSVRESVPACHAGCPRAEFRPTTLPLVSGTFGHVLTSQGALLVVVLVLVLVAGLVVFPAVWSSDRDRRKAALAVLKLLVRWRP